MKAQVAAYYAVLNDIVYAFSSFLRSATVLSPQRTKGKVGGGPGPMPTKSFPDMFLISSSNFGVGFPSI